MDDSPAPSTPAARLAALAPGSLPVLRASALAIARLAARPDDADASRIADIALRDPLLCLRLLQHVASTLGPRLRSPVQTVTAALVLTGIEPFFRAFADLPVLEDRLAERPAAQRGALACIARAHAAARIAVAFAVHRQDDDVELLHQAALLHDFAEVLLWCEAPVAALALQALRSDAPGREEEEQQRCVLGETLTWVGRELLQRWSLPATLCDAARACDPDGPAGQTVRLAVRIAHHLQDGWHHPALAAELERAGLLLNLPPAGAASLVRHAL
jgi:HD-like signal output (HDOD) protein